ncbi:hypothetical protein DSM3645_01891 [Blastopirellula marina DSM 3645]|uniref:Uncharacterized protein n=1 Tax=Blastopirellula marina DSM 3645 TaxID=314230 RepID=A4A0L3_9BACT|nr:hypothetical protein DSM3645_01891 [Blastopirellula marina DSM 3645]
MEKVGSVQPVGAVIERHMTNAEPTLTVGLIAAQRRAMIGRLTMQRF